MQKDTQRVVGALYRVPDVAQRLSVSVRTIWAWIATERLPAIRLGRRATRVDPADVERLIAEARARAGR